MEGDSEESRGGEGGRTLSVLRCIVMYWLKVGGYNLM